MTLTDIRPEHHDELVLMDDEPVFATALEPYVDDLAVTLDADDWSVGSLSGAVEHCIARFATAEADVASPERIGMGHVAGSRRPRLGGVLHQRLAAGSAAADALAIGVGQTVRAGYERAVATPQVAGVPVLHVDADELWAAFVPASYRIPRPVATAARDLCQFDQYWVTLLCDIGLHDDARRFALGRVSPLSRSIRGLSTIGVVLAVSERGGRRDRRPGEHRSRRGHPLPMRRLSARASRPDGEVAA